MPLFVLLFYCLRISHLSSLPTNSPSIIDHDLSLTVSCDPLLRPVNSISCCQHVPGCSTICWSTGSLSEATDSPSSHQLPITLHLGLEFMGFSSIHSGTWAGLILCRSCAYSYSHCELVHYFQCMGSGKLTQVDSFGRIHLYPLNYPAASSYL